MTGFGRGAASGDEFTVAVEIKTVNNRFLDIHLRHGETVYAAADRLRLLKIPFAFMTAYGKAEIDPRYAGTRVICKPATAEEIESCLSALMPGKQTDQEIRPLS